MLTTKQLSLIFEAIFDKFSLSEKPEITIEVNPASVSIENIHELASLPINRISLGIQSFNDDMLVYLGRPHTATDAYNTYNAFRESGFESISCDLIFAIPGQSMNDWKTNVSEMIKLHPEHISLYAFSFDKDSYFTQQYNQGKLSSIDESLEHDMYEYAINTLCANGYDHYEISNFALPGYASRHNRLYWKNQSYIGIGAGAYSYIDGTRYCAVRDIDKYIKSLKENKTPYIEHEQLTPEQSLRETAALNIRLLQEGIFYPELSKRYPDLNVNEMLDTAIEKLRTEGLLDRAENQRYVLTRKGIMFADLAASSLL